MSRRDTYHDVVKRALVKDGWTISHDPLRITYRGTTVSTDLGAEKATMNEGQRIAMEIIAVEVKDFDSKHMTSGHIYRNDFLEAGFLRRGSVWSAARSRRFAL